MRLHGLPYHCFRVFCFHNTSVLVIIDTITYNESQVCHSFHQSYVWTIKQCLRDLHLIILCILWWLSVLKCKKRHRRNFSKTEKMSNLMVRISVEVLGLMELAIIWNFAVFFVWLQRISIKNTGTCCRPVDVCKNLTLHLFSISCFRIATLPSCKKSKGRSSSSSSDEGKRHQGFFVGGSEHRLIRYVFSFHYNKLYSNMHLIFGMLERFYSILSKHVAKENLKYGSWVIKLLGHSNY